MVNTFKPAIAENYDYVARFRQWLYPMQYIVDLRLVKSRDSTLLNALHNPLGVQAIMRRKLVHSRNPGQNNAVSKFESLRKGALKNCASRGVGAGLKNRPDFVSRVSMAQSEQCLSNRRGVMPKIVNYFDSVDFSAEFLPARHAVKTYQRAANFLQWQSIG